MSKREASHAGSWYDDHEYTLTTLLDGWLGNVDKNIDGIGNIPQPGARAIIAPHAGYAYSGPAAAWAYKSLDFTNAASYKRIFLLGPSHHTYLPGCALSKHAYYSTPMGDLPLDKTIMATLRSSGQFSDMSHSSDSAEHSLEMHLPFIYRLLATHLLPAQFPPLVPILVGSTSPSVEKAFGILLAPHLADPENLFIISSDFCHWGSRFQYTYYLPDSAAEPAEGIHVAKKDRPSHPPIHESIARIDRLAMRSVESGKHDAFLATIQDTGNTVCGRHPIGVFMAAVEELKKEGKLAEDKGKFKFVRYERSSEVSDGRDSSVSYASAFAVL